jgi:hypothetical protein
LDLVNTTPFVGHFGIVPDKDGYETLVAVLKGTFAIGPRGCEPAEAQAELVAADVFSGEPGVSSVVYESDLALYKPATDVVLVGRAYAPKVGTKRMEVSLAVGSLRQTARVSGDRRWSVALGIARIAGPKPFETIPLTWERAFGGVQPKKDGEGFEGAEPRNPIGTGYVKKKRRAFVDGLALPNIEDPKRALKRLGQKPPPVGFGFTGRHWFPRRRLLGTYDDAWQKQRMPLLPSDFDDRALCGAPAALQASPHLVGGEPVRAIGVSPRGALDFPLPAPRPKMEAFFEGAWRPLDSALDTVVIEPDVPRVMLSWRARLRVHGKVRALRAVRMSAEGRA